MKSLDDYLVLDEQGKIREINLYPYQEVIANLYLTAIELILIAIECVGTIFQIKLDERIAPLKERLAHSAKLHLQP